MKVYQLVDEQKSRNVAHLPPGCRCRYIRWCQWFGGTVPVRRTAAPSATDVRDDIALIRDRVFTNFNTLVTPSWRSAPAKRT